MDSSVGVNELIRFNQRARGALQRQAKRRRREIESFGLPCTAGELMSAAVWLDIAARCRAVALSENKNFSNFYAFDRLEPHIFFLEPPLSEGGHNR